MRFLAMFLVFLCALNAEGNIYSNIPTAKIEVINLNPTPCGKSCLKDLAKNQKIFSYIARFSREIEDEDLVNLMMDYTRQIGVYYKVRFELLENELKVALLIPKKTIGAYSTTTIDTILSYLAFRDIDFKFKVFDSVDESAESILKALAMMKDEHFNFAIAILQKKENLSLLSDLHIPLYIPTIRKPADWDSKNEHIIFGGIDYFAQVEMLMKEGSGDNIISYDDDSAIGSDIGASVEAQSGDYKFYKEVVTNKDATNFSAHLERQKNILKESSVFLNTRVVISGLLLSQIGILKEMPKRILSTQVNYNPTLLSLLRGINTKNLLIANSIGDSDDRLLEYSALLSGDLKYEWVNYSTALGVDLFLSKMKDGIERYFKESVEDSQVVYKTRLYGVENNIFVER